MNQNRELPAFIARSLEFIEFWLPLRYSACDIPGFSVAISHKGQIAFNKAFGYANLETKEPLRSDHLFRVASHSKTFTTVAILQLQESGKLRIDDSIVKYLPWLGKHSDERWKNVTIRQLISHGAGVIRDGEDSDYWQILKPFPSNEEIRANVLESRLILDNNRKFKYSNYGYALLGQLIENVTNRPFNEYIVDQVVRKSSLPDTGPEYCDQVRERMVRGHLRADTNKVRKLLPVEIDTRGMSAATGFFATAQDLCMFYNSLCVGQNGVIGDESKKALQHTEWPIGNSADRREYGLGITIEYEDRTRLFGHGGGFPGQITRTVCDPEENLVVSTLTNCIDSDPLAIAKSIVAVFNQFKRNKKSKKSSAEELSKFEGRFESVWQIKEIVQKRNKLIACNLSTWRPFDVSNSEELDYVDDQTLRITECNGYSAERELVHYDFDASARANSIRYAGTTMTRYSVNRNP